MNKCKTCAFNKYKICKEKRQAKFKYEGCERYIEDRNNCLACQHFFECKKDKKGINFICLKFKDIKNYKSTSANLDEIKIIEFGDTNKKDESDFDILEVIEKIVADDFKEIPADIRINDSDFPLAKNFWEFCFDKQFLGIKPFPKQMEIGIKLFQDYCPVCSNNKFLESIKVRTPLGKFRDNIVLLEHGKCPKCGKTRLDFLRKKLFPDLYDELGVCAGQRSGKSILTAIISNYIIHRYMKIQNPIKSFGLLPGTVLHGTFVALTFKQVVETLWLPFIELNKNSEWFKSYYSFLEDKSQRYGERLLKLREEFLFLRHKGLLIYPSGPNMKTLRGRTRFLGSIDELGWFPIETDNVKQNAEEVYIALERSLKTLRTASRKMIRKGNYNLPTAYFVNISSPSFAKDKIMQIIRQSNYIKRIFAMHEPTWRMNPNMSKKDFADEYRKDPIAAERDYGANPPLSRSPFVSSIKTISECISTVRKNHVKLNFVVAKSKVGNLYSYAKAVIKGKDNTPKILAIDAGYSNNQFAFCLSHLRHDDVKVIDAVGTIPPENGSQINFTKVYKEVICPIIENMNVVVFATDRWQSIKIMHDVEEKYGIDVIQYSLKYKDMLNVRNNLIEKLIRIPKPEYDEKTILDTLIMKNPSELKSTPISYLIMQILTVIDTGKSIVKGEGFDDDIWRAFALATTLLDYDDIKQIMKKKSTSTRSGINDLSSKIIGINRSSGAVINVQGTYGGLKENAVVGNKTIGVLIKR